MEVFLTEFIDKRDSTRGEVNGLAREVNSDDVVTCKTFYPPRPKTTNHV